MTIAIQQPEHAPWLGFFDKMSKVDKYVFLDNVQFKKRYFENRNKIRTPKGWQWVTVPVLTKARYKQNINEVMIDNAQEWRRRYLNALKYSYSKAPFFEKHFPEIKKIIDFPSEKLVDLNTAIILYLRKLFRLEHVEIIKASDLALGKKFIGSNLILRICNLLEADSYISGPDGVNYLKLEEFRSEGIEVKFHAYSHPVYRQLHKPFVDHLSSLDFIFNCTQE